VVLAYAVFFLIILALLLRRDLSAIGRISYRGGWKLAAIVAGLFVLQAMLVLYVPGQTVFQMALLVLSQIALIFLFFLNRHVPGAKLFALGIILNTTVMVANGGWMPVTPETYHFVHPDLAVGVQARPSSSKNIILPDSETKLWILSDIIHVTLPWRRNAVSIGDLLLILGLAQFIFQATSRREKPLPGWSDLKEPRTASKEER
jgi:hypothetical protein